MATIEKQIMVRVTQEQLAKLEDIRAAQRPIPSLSELVRQIVSEYLARKE